jgi:hypothetical protein
MSPTKPASTPQAPRTPAQDPKPKGKAQRHVVPRTDTSKDALLTPDIRAVARALRLEKRAERAAKRKPKSQRETTAGTSIKDRKGTQAMPGGPSANELATAVVDESERRYRCFQLKLAGATYEQIGKQVGVSSTTAHYDVHQVLREYDTALRAMAGEAKTLAIAETYKVQLAMMVAMEKGDTRAAQVILNCISLRARLQGTFAPVKIAPTDPTGTRPFGQEATEALRAELLEFLGLPAAALPVLQRYQESRIPTYDPALDGPDEPVTVDVVASGGHPAGCQCPDCMARASSNGHHPAAVPGDDYNGEGGS